MVDGNQEPRAYFFLSLAEAKGNESVQSAGPFARAFGGKVSRWCSMVSLHLVAELVGGVCVLENV